MNTKAKRRALVPTEQQPERIVQAIHNLNHARYLLRTCGSKNAADYVARALKSAEGALRHARRLRFEADQAERYRLYVETGDERLRSDQAERYRLYVETGDERLRG